MKLGSIKIGEFGRFVDSIEYFAYLFCSYKDGRKNNNVTMIKSVLCANFGDPRSRDCELKHKKT